MNPEIENTKKPNFLILSGNGRNAGKTSFACKIIECISKEHPITAIKISPHFHADLDKGVLLKEKHFIIRQEENHDDTKDTSRMLRAGAGKVYYLEVLDDHLKEAMDALEALRPLNDAVICESGGLRRVIHPSLFIVLNRVDGRETKESYKTLSPMADKVVMFDGTNFDLEAEDISFKGNEWFIGKKRG